MDKPEIFLTGDREKDTRRATYFIFLAAVSILSFSVSVLFYLITDTEVSQVLFVLDTVYAVIFLIDFGLRLRSANDRRRYMLRWGWLDLLTSIPGIPALRIIRSILVFRDARQIFESTSEEIVAQARSRLAESVLFVTAFVGLIVITLGSIAIVIVEADAPNAEITSGYDAIWWSLVTVSTVGYGDEVPVTVSGRFIGALFIIVGVALFTTITSYLASTFTDKGARMQRDEQVQLARENARHMEHLLERIMALEKRIAENLEVGEDEEDSPDL